MAGILQGISDMIAGGLLRGYDAITDRESLPSNQRVYLSTVLDRNTEELTNKDFTPQELAAIQRLVQMKGGGSGTGEVSEREGSGWG